MHVLTIILAYWGIASVYLMVGLFLAYLAYNHLPLSGAGLRLILIGWPFCIMYALYKIIQS